MFSQSDPVHTKPSPAFPTQAPVVTVIDCDLQASSVLCFFPFTSPLSPLPQKIKSMYTPDHFCRVRLAQRKAVTGEDFLSFSSPVQNHFSFLAFRWNRSHAKYRDLWLKTLQRFRSLGSPGFAGIQDLRSCFARKRTKSTLSWSTAGPQTVSSFWLVTAAPPVKSYPSPWIIASSSIT